MIIKIDALDTLFFRDGKPFTMGEDTWANGLFLPYPSVFYGALRSAYFAKHIEKLNKASNNDDPTKGLKIKGIYYFIGGDIYVPLPADCVKEKDDKDKTIKVSTLSMKKNENQNGCPTDYILSYDNDKKIANVWEGLVRGSMFKKYLMLQVSEFSIKTISDYVMSEPKIGIARSSKTHSSKEGMLYRVDMKRLENKKGEKMTIVVEFEGLDDLSEKVLMKPKRGLMKLGGEGKAVSYKECDKECGNKISFDKFNLENNRFKLYLSTPAIFKNGWIPKWIDEKTLIGEYKEFKLKLLTASIGKPIHIGGFDIKARKPKPMYKAVPAGSVYYFEVIEGNLQKAFEIFNQKAISDVYPDQGFGIAYVGKVK